MSNVGRIKKVESGFSIIPNEILRNPNVSLKAKGLFGIIISFPDDWTLYKLKLQEYSKDGRDATIVAFNELVALGYIEEKDVRDSSGKFAGVEYTVHMKPIKKQEVEVEVEYLQKEEVDDRFYLASKKVRVYQPKLKIPCDYNKQDFVIFRSIDFDTIVPSEFALQYFKDFGALLYEGFCRNELKNFSKKDEEFERLLKKAFSKHHTRFISDLPHLLNCVRIVVKEEERRLPITHKKAPQQEGYQRGLTSHDKGWT